MGSNKKTILFVQVARFLPIFVIWDTFPIFALAFLSEVASSEWQDTLRTHMLSVCYLAYIQTPRRNTHKNCPDQRTIATKLCRCVNEISGAGQTKSCRLKAEPLMDPFCVDAGWDESVSKNITLKVQMIHLLPVKHCGIMSTQLCQTS